MSSLYRNWWFPVAAGILVTPLLGRIAVNIAGGGHGSYLPAVIFFPWAIFLSLQFNHFNSAAFVLATIQWPIYGIVLNPRSDSFGRKAWPLAGCHVGMLILTLLWDRQGILGLW